MLSYVFHLFRLTELVRYDIICPMNIAFECCSFIVCISQLHLELEHKCISAYVKFICTGSFVSGFLIFYSWWQNSELQYGNLFYLSVCKEISDPFNLFINFHLVIYLTFIYYGFFTLFIVTICRHWSACCVLLLLDDLCFLMTPLDWSFCHS